MMTGNRREYYLELQSLEVASSRACDMMVVRGVRGARPGRWAWFAIDRSVRGDNLKWENLEALQSEEQFLGRVQIRRSGQIYLV